MTTQSNIPDPFAHLFSINYTTLFMLILGVLIPIGLMFFND